MSAIILELVVLTLLIILNGIFAMSELAVMSARKARLIELADNGSAGAKNALDLAEAPNRFLSTVQVGITLVGVMAGAFGGATIARVLGEQLDTIDPLAPYAKALGLGIVVLGITYFSLVIGELVPKRLALHNPERVASLVARPMQLLASLSFPVVRLLSISTNTVVRLMGLTPSHEPPVTEEEIRIMIEQGTEAGIFHTSEQDMVKSVFQLDDRHLNTLMTPHTEMVWLDINASPDEVQRKIIDSGHSRYPVCRDNLDNLLGIVHASDLLCDSLDTQSLDLEAHLRPPRYVPENATASRIVDLFKRTQQHLVLVIDEYGGIQGLVTEHDLLEAIVGDLPSPGEIYDPDVVDRGDGSWLLDGMMTIDELKELLDIDVMPGEERGTYQTLSGFVMSRIGAIPHTGQCFHWGGFRFEVVDMDGRRVDKILVAQAPGTPDAAICDD
jgi:putative hemolysin